MKTSDQFIAIHKEGNPLTSSQRVVFADKRTGVNYLFIQSGYAGGLTPLLGADGKPVVTDFSKEK